MDWGHSRPFPDLRPLYRVWTCPLSQVCLNRAHCFAQVVSLSLGLTVPPKPQGGIATGTGTGAANLFGALHRNLGQCLEPLERVHEISNVFGVEVGVRLEQRCPFQFLPLPLPHVDTLRTGVGRFPVRPGPRAPRPSRKCCEHQ